MTAYSYNRKPGFCNLRAVRWASFMAPDPKRIINEETTPSNDWKYVLNQILEINVKTFPKLSNGNQI